MMTAGRELIAALFPGTSWAPWRAAVAAMLAVPPEADEHALFERCTGRSAWPTEPARRAFYIVGRRGGKSTATGRTAVMLGTKDYSRVLAPGERGIGMIVAPDRRQARVTKRYASAVLHAGLSKLIESETAESISLSNGVDIEVHTRNHVAPRGYTVVFAACEEFAFWPADGAASPDTEVLMALEPAMATVPGAVLMAISSPYARKGELWRAYHEHFGKDGDVLVWMADTRTMNPQVPQRVIDRAFEQDEVAAASEFGRDGQIAFRRDVETFISKEALDACVVSGRLELPAGVSA